MLADAFRPFPTTCVSRSNWKSEIADSTYGRLGSFRSASVSSVVSVVAPKRNPPPPPSVSPGVMKIRLLPNPRTSCVMPCWAPWPAAISAMTAPTPMTMPSIVSPVRSLFVVSSCTAVRRISNTIMLSSPPSGVRIRTPPPACPIRYDHLSSGSPDSHTRQSPPRA